MICIIRHCTWAVAAVLWLAAPSSARAADPGWHQALRNQLVNELQCELQYLTNERAFELLGRHTLSVRAHCTDKRAFDATRREGDPKFTFKSCESVAC